MTSARWRERLWNLRHGESAGNVAPDSTSSVAFISHPPSGERFTNGSPVGELPDRFGEPAKEAEKTSGNVGMVSQIGHVSNFFKQPSVEARRIIEVFKALRDEAA